MYLFHKLFSDYDIFILPGISVYIILFYFSLCIFFLPFVLSDSIFFSLCWYVFFLHIFFFPFPLGFLQFSFFNLCLCFFFPCFLSFFNFSHFFPWMCSDISLASPVLLNKNYGLCQLIHIYLRKYCIFPSCHSLIFIPEFLWSKRVLSFCS